VSPPSASAGAPAGLLRLFWRVHCWAGLALAPLLLFAAATGLLYVLAPSVEAWRHAALDRVAVGAQPQPLDTQLAVARAALPGWQAVSIVPGAQPGAPEASTQVLFRPPPDPHAGHAAPAAAGHDHGLPRGRIAYVDPYRAELLGTLDELARFRTWSKKLHASFLQGHDWRWPIELAASWALLMLATGLALAWPTPRSRGGTGWRALLPRRGAGRARWREWHAFVGLLASGVIVVLLLTGLTWSRHAGDNFRSALQALGQQSPRPPAGLRAPPPAEGAVALSVQALHERARALTEGRALQLTLPNAADAPWRVEVLASADRANPQQRLSLLLDAYEGRELYRSGWAELPLLAKATAVGIPFHRGEFGLWNRGLLAAAALALMFSVLSGLRMAWLRRPRGGLGAPPVSAATLRALPAWLWALGLALAFALPVFGLSLLVFIALEAGAAGLVRLRRPA
jgi:uncharacterized iron-regulated membrane protein